MATTIKKRVAKAKTQAQEVETHDLGLAAFYQTSGVRMLGTRREGARVFFRFEGGEDTTELTTEWFAMTGMVVANSYASALRNLKALCFAE